MIELDVNISDVQYSDFFDRFIPNLLKTLREKGDLKNPVLRAASKRPETSAKIVKGFIASMPKSSMEHLMCKLANANEDMIVTALNNLCQKNNIKVVLDSAEAVAEQNK